MEENCEHMIFKYTFYSIRHEEKIKVTEKQKSYNTFEKIIYNILYKRNIYINLVKWYLSAGTIKKPHISFY